MKPRTDAEVRREALPERELPLLEALLQRRVRVPKGEASQPRRARLAQRGVDGAGHRLFVCVCGLLGRGVMGLLVLVHD